MPTTPPTEPTDFMLDEDDPSEYGEPLRCAICLAGAVHDARIGTTAGAGHIAVVMHNGMTLCFDHFAKIADIAALVDLY